MYFVVLFLFFTFIWYQSRFSLTEIKSLLNKCSLWQSVSKPFDWYCTFSAVGTADHFVLKYCVASMLEAVYTSTLYIHQLIECLVCSHGEMWQMVVWFPPVKWERRWLKTCKKYIYGCVFGITSWGLKTYIRCYIMCVCSFSRLQHLDSSLQLASWKLWDFPQ